MKEFLKKINTRLVQKHPYLARLGMAAFLFFLIKGLVWIAVFIWAYLKIKS